MGVKSAPLASNSRRTPTFFFLILPLLLVLLLLLLLLLLQCCRGTSSSRIRSITFLVLFTPSFLAPVTLTQTIAQQTTALRSWRVVKLWVARREWEIAIEPTYLLAESPYCDRFVKTGRLKMVSAKKNSFKNLSCLHVKIWFCSVW